MSSEIEISLDKSPFSTHTCGAKDLLFHPGGKTKRFGLVRETHFLTRLWHIRYDAGFYVMGQSSSNKGVFQNGKFTEACLQ
jgi:hypothetical protein